MLFIFINLSFYCNLSSINIINIQKTFQNGNLINKLIRLNINRP